MSIKGFTKTMTSNIIEWWKRIFEVIVFVIPLIDMSYFASIYIYIYIYILSILIDLLRIYN